MPLKLELKPAYTLMVDTRAALFDTAFSGSFGSHAHFTDATLAHYIARENIDVQLSRIVLYEGSGDWLRIPGVPGLDQPSGGFWRDRQTVGVKWQSIEQEGNEAHSFLDDLSHQEY